MKYYITETATYTVEAKTAQEALELFKTKLTCPFEVEVSERDIVDENDLSYYNT